MRRQRQILALAFKRLGKMVLSLRWLAPRLISVSTRGGIIVAFVISLLVSTVFALCLLREQASSRLVRWLRLDAIVRRLRVGEWLEYLRRVELKSLDLRFLLRNEIAPTGQVIIVAIDEETLAREKTYPLPRRLYARVVDRLVEYGAKTITFDVMFIEPHSREAAQRVEEAIARYKARFPSLPKDDLVLRLLEGEREDIALADAFRRALEKGVPVVTAIHFLTPEEMATERIPMQQLSDASRRILVESAFFRKEPVRADSRNLLGLFLRDLVCEKIPPRHAQSVLTATLPIAEASAALGYVDYALDMDGAVRSEFLVTEFENEFYPPLGLQALIWYLDLDPRKDVVLRFEAEEKPGPTSGPRSRKLKFCESIRLGNREIPLEQDARLLINFRGKTRTFPTYSLSSVIAGELPPETFKDKLVLVGATAKAAGDLLVTPCSARLPGVEKHANLIDCILRGDYLVRDHRVVCRDLLTIFAVGLLAGLMMAFLSASAGLMATLVLWAGITVSCYQDFVHHQVWRNMTYPSLTILLSSSLVTLYRFSTEGRSRRRVKRIFEQYMQASVVTEVLRHAQNLKLGGDVREITVFFSDLAGFSTISEELTPQGVIAFLNEVYDEMAPAILQRNAFLDKFWGDAVVAAFGVPIQRSDHAVQACLAALDCQERLSRLNERLRAQGRPLAKARIGLHSGLAVVGNVGSQVVKRFNYTALGDAVNVGARLESTNKDFQTNIILSGATYELAKYAVEARKLGTILVKGRKEPVPVYELLGEINKTPGHRLVLADIFRHGLELYLKRDWDGAIFAFQKALAHSPNDGPSLVYLRACRAFKENPPPDDWDGILVMKEGKD